MWISCFRYTAKCISCIVWPWRSSLSLTDRRRRLYIIILSRTLRSAHDHILYIIIWSVIQLRLIVKIFIHLFKSEEDINETRDKNGGDSLSVVLAFCYAVFFLFLGLVVLFLTIIGRRRCPVREIWKRCLCGDKTDENNLPIIRQRKKEQASGKIRIIQISLNSSLRAGGYINDHRYRSLRHSVVVVPVILYINSLVLCVILHGLLLALLTSPAYLL